MKTNASINVKDLSDKDFAAKYQDRVRHGKTRKDHANGYAARAAANKQRPIRCTSSNKLAMQDNRNESYWQG